MFYGMEGAYVVKSGSYFIERRNHQHDGEELKLSKVLNQECLIHDKETAAQLKSETDGNLYTVKLERVFDFEL